MPTDGTILVFDDDAAIRDAVVDFLGSEGYRVHGVSHGTDPLEWLRRERARSWCSISSCP